MDQQHYVGLEATSICVIDQTGATVWRGKCATEPDALAFSIPNHIRTSKG